MYPIMDTTNDLSPINDLKAVTPNDSTDLPNGPCRGLLFTTAGNVSFDTAAGTTVTIPVNSRSAPRVQPQPAFSPPTKEKSKWH